MRIFVNSYTYIYERHLRVFDFFHDISRITFILPKVWKAKGGKIIVRPPVKSRFNIIPTWSPFYHSRYPIIRGMLKGWMPWCGRILRKIAKPGDVLFSATEPNLLTTYIYGRLARRLGMKHVFLSWQNIPYEKRLSGWKLKLARWFLRNTIALSAGGLFGTRQALEIHKPYLPPNFPVAVIPQSGVDVDIFRPDIASDFRKKHNLENKIVYLFAAVFDERKGVFTTIDAFKDVLSHVPDGHLIMIGIGKLWEPAQRHVRELGIAHAVTFLEWMPNQELPGVFASVDILVHPSEPFKGWEEQYGWTMLQAEASGLPVISTNIGAIGEAVIDGVTGLLVPYRDVSALAQAMITLAHDPVRRKQMGLAGRRHILEQYSHAKVAERMEKFLTTLS